MTYSEFIQFFEKELKRILSYYYKNETFSYLVEDENYIYNSVMGPSLINVNVTINKVVLDGNVVVKNTYNPFITFYKYVMQYKSKTNQFATVYLLEKNNQLYFIVHFEDQEAKIDLIDTYQFSPMEYKLNLTEEYFIYPDV